MCKEKMVLRLLISVLMSSLCLNLANRIKTVPGRQCVRGWLPSCVVRHSPKPSHTTVGSETKTPGRKRKHLFLDAVWREVCVSLSAQKICQIPNGVTRDTMRRAVLASQEWFTAAHKEVLCLLSASPVYCMLRRNSCRGMTDFLVHCHCCKPQSVMRHDKIIEIVAIHWGRWWPDTFIHPPTPNIHKPTHPLPSVFAEGAVFNCFAMVHNSECSWCGTSI